MRKLENGDFIFDPEDIYFHELVEAFLMQDHPEQETLSAEIKEQSQDTPPPREKD